MNTTIYFFSGTGNSFKIAKDLADNIDDSRIVRINNTLLESPNIQVSGKIGIVFPVYVGALPAIVEEFINMLEIDDKAYVFAVASFGGSAGVSLVQLNDLLNRKGKALSAAFGILMPDNTQIMFPPTPEEEQMKRFKLQEEVIPEIASMINKGTVDSETIEDLRKRSGELENRHRFVTSEMDKNFKYDDKCSSCGTCEKVCPVNNIVMSDNRPEWQGYCQQCLACMQYCPEESIQFGDKTTEWGRYHHPDIDVQELFRETD